MGCAPYEYGRGFDPGLDSPPLSARTAPSNGSPIYGCHRADVIRQAVLLLSDRLAGRSDSVCEGAHGLQ